QLAFRRGQLLTASSSVPEERLGAMLVRAGKVSEEQVQDAQRDVTPQRRLGLVLVERDHVTAADLYEVCKRQAEEIFYSVLLLARGPFYFIAALEEDGVAVRLHLDTQALLIEGLARIDEMEFFRQVVPSATVILTRRRPSTPNEPQ